MDTHNEDPRDQQSEGVSGDPSQDEHDDPWEHASAQFTVIGEKLRDRYRELVGESGPAETEVRDALSTIGTAAQSLVEAMGDSVRDPEVRGQLKQASSSFFAAIGKTLSQLGDDLKRSPTADESPSTD